MGEQKLNITNSILMGREETEVETATPDTIHIILTKLMQNRLFPLAYRARTSDYITTVAIGRLSIRLSRPSSFVSAQFSYIGIVVDKKKRKQS